MPSVRSTISAITSAGSLLLPTRLAMMVAASRSPSRLSTKVVTCDRPAHGALNSGRKVTMSSAGRVLIRSTALPKASRLVGSDQCASSKIISTGLERASTSTCEPSACNVRCLRVPGSDRAPDTVHRSAATASPQRVRRPAQTWMPARAPHRACRALPSACRRAPMRPRVPSDR